MGAAKRNALSSVLAASLVVGGFACNAVLRIDELELGECRTGERRCASSVQPQVCDETRYWRNEAACVDQTCQLEDGACVGECLQGNKRCGGTTRELCDADGKWQQLTPCESGQVCQGGECKVVCIPGDLRCKGNQPQLCGPTGDWQDKGDRCSPCYGCDEATGQCADKPKPEGAACDDDNPCTLVTQCEGTGAGTAGVCTAKVKVECFGEDACSAGPCNASTGSCAVADGTSCEDGDACTSTSTCSGGVCGQGGGIAFARWDLKSPMPSQRFDWQEYGPGFEDREVVYDRSTGLLWERRMKEEKELRDFDQAKVYCEGLSLPGYPSGWRLPTRIELASLVDYTKAAAPTIDTDAFPWIAGNLGDVIQTFWSSSPSAKDSNEAWIVAFNVGLVLTTTRSFQKNVRCIHDGGKQTSSSACTDRYNVDAATVTDKNTNLMWQRADDGTPRTLFQADGYCATLTLGGYTDWRLPTIFELQTIVDESKNAPALDTAVFDGGVWIYWSATSSAINSNDQWTVDFGVDFAGGWTRHFPVVGLTQRARCVR